MSESLGQLKHKRRTIRDLARHLKNRTDEQPNYILFLGAGASITSGIRSGSKLVEVWKNEIYNSENTELSLSLEEWLKTQLSWYDDNNEYSSLFEKRFDLPAQRRNFIEAEVSDKIPFIGYAYLVKLVNKNFINTIMTTNFDDLLSEAFYIYGDHNNSDNYRSLNRPIICAHDSTINSININSKRPKIIKLHGDYLYDNIKSSLRETESLETNIKNKLIELSKNKGLIVIGYAGSDRSIMDTLNFLLSNEDYLKHGVYWCLRKGDPVSKSLEKLLWKDRVYFVEIDGYDELMAELNHNINNGQLPIETNVTMESYNFLTKKLLENNDISNEYIKGDIAKLVLQKESKILTDFFETLNIQSVDSRDKSKKSSNNLKTEEEVFLIQERKKLKSDDEFAIDEIIANCKSKMLDETNVISNEFKIEILELMSRCYELKNNYPEALKKIRDIEEIDPNITKYFQKKIRLIENFDEKLRECDKNIEQDEYNYIPYVQKVIIKLNHIKDNAIKMAECDKTDIEIDLKKAIELEPGKHNMAYYIYVDFLLKYKKSNNVNTLIPGKPQNTICTIEARDLLKIVAKQDPFDSEIVKSNCEIMEKEGKTNIEIKDYILKKIEEAPALKKEELYTLCFDFYFKVDMKDDIKKLLKLVEEKDIYKNDIETLVKTRANIEFKYNKNLKEAIKIYLDNAHHLSNKYLYELAELYLYNDNLEEAKELIFSKIKSSFSLKKSYYIKTCQFDLALEELEKPATKSHFTKLEYIRNKSFILLHAEKYQDVYTFLIENKIESIDDIEEIRDILCNFEFTKKKLGKTPCLKKISKEKDTIFEIAYNFLSDDHKKTKVLINEKISKDYSYKYLLREWCYFKGMNEYNFIYD